MSTPATSLADPSPPHRATRARLVLGALGVVYGDIGTSPIYAFREGLRASGGGSEAAVIGLVSLFFWALILVVTVKYVVLVLRADNQGEGGTLSLFALTEGALGRRSPVLLALAVAGTAMFFGDALVTPAISVLSAVEGMALVAPGLEPLVLPAALAILFALFWAQSRGTARVASLFGPLTLVWFVVLAALGLWHIADAPQILTALDPRHAVSFLLNGGTGIIPVLAAVFLAVTGAEALYADMGHFGRGPIRIAWSVLVQPALTLAYAGQGALVLANPEAASNPFFLMAPSVALLPLVLLATVATVIASQAVISGAFSIARQAMLLGLLPRMRIIHTSETEIGQIYFPRINRFLLIGVILLVAVFESSDALAAAYGLAVSGDMVITTILLMVMVRLRWRWSPALIAAVFLPILVIELGFLTANITKIPEGGFMILGIAAWLAVTMWTWVRGRAVLSDLLKERSTRLGAAIRQLARSQQIKRVSGTAVFLATDPDYAPSALLHNVKHNKVLHDRNLILTVETACEPVVPATTRMEIEDMGEGFTRIRMRFGYSEQVNVPLALAMARRAGLGFDLMSTSFFLHRRKFRPSPNSVMPRWQSALFVSMARNASDATGFYHLPSNRTIELGEQVAI
jgi:KUP system potassium uptake protein